MAAGWVAAAGAVLGGLGSSGILGGGGDVDVPSVGEQTNYGIRAANIGTQTPFGGTTLIHDRGSQIYGDNAEDDDTFTLRQTLSPEMQAISDALLAQAGASRASFSSGGMPQGLQDIYANTVLNYSIPQEYRTSVLESKLQGRPLDSFMPALSSYERPEYGFGGTEEPLELPEADPANIEGMNNLDLYQAARDAGALSSNAMNWFEKGNKFERPHWLNSDSLLTGNFNPYAPGVHLDPANQGYFMELIDYGRSIGGAPDFTDSANNPYIDWPGAENVDLEALNNLTNSLTR